MVIVVMLGACEVPNPKLNLGFSAGPSQACPATSCEQIPLSCDAVMSIRMYDPKDPDVALVDQCNRVKPNDKDGTLCSYRSIDLAPVELPVTDLKVEVSFYPLSRATYNAETDTYTCPPAGDYSAANGFPSEIAPAPAIGGRGFYHPGDDQVAVTLGCTNLAAINEDPTCVTDNVPTQITATVNDFGTRLPVLSGAGPDGASALRVAIGEPVPYGNGFVLNPADELELKLHDALTPTWLGQLDRAFYKNICLDVMQFGIESTGVLHCVPANFQNPQIALTGVRLQREQLRTILTALKHAPIPESGLTIGVVLDASSRGAANYEIKVSPAGPTVSYLARNSEMFEGTKTDDSGIFISTDAPFDTTFSASGARTTVSAVGGNVAGKITIVFLAPPASVPAQ